MSRPDLPVIVLVEPDDARRRELAAWLKRVAPVLGARRCAEVEPALGSRAVCLALFAWRGEDPKELASLSHLRDGKLAGVPLAFIVDPRTHNVRRARQLVAPLEPAGFVRADAGRLGVRNAARALATRQGAPKKPPEEPAQPVEPKPTQPAPTRVSRAELEAAHGEIQRQNHFGRLAAARDATAAQLRDAFARQMVRFAPRAVETSDDDGRRMLREIHVALSSAYKVLADPGQRQRYEAALDAKPSPAPPKAPPEPAAAKLAAPPRPHQSFVDDRAPWERLATAAGKQAAANDYSGAIGLMRKAVRMKPDNEEMRYQLALYEAKGAGRKGDRLSSLRAWRIAAELAPDDETQAVAQKEVLRLEKELGTGGLLGKLKRWRKRD